MNEEPYLYHHGVKGMKWGRRKDRGRVSSRISRKERKQMRRDRNNISRTEMGKANKKYDVNKKWNTAEKQAQKIYDKKGTSAIAEDKTYQKLYNQYDKASSLAKSEAGKKTIDALTKKYGKQKVDKFVSSEAKRVNASYYSALVGAPLLTTVLGGAYLYSKYKR